MSILLPVSQTDYLNYILFFVFEHLKAYCRNLHKIKEQKRYSKKVSRKMLPI